jgi:nucleoside-diphosphate-sugar epimerase
MNVLVTGSASHLARALLPRLAAVPGVARITGVDLKPTAFAHDCFTARTLDIGDPRLADLLPGHDALVHLAFVVLRGRMPAARMQEINVAGTLAVFRAARAAGVRRLVHLSSAGVYGSGVHLDETAPLAPLAGFLYAEHKAMVERMLAPEFPEAVRLRPHVILGPNAQPLLRSLVRKPLYVRLQRPYPLLQCVHEQDVADAIILALQGGAAGAFNLATEESFTWRDLIRSRHRLALPLPLPAVRAGHRLAWKSSGWGGEPGWINGLTHTLTLNSRRALAELGWRPRYDLAATLAAA